MSENVLVVENRFLRPHLLDLSGCLIRDNNARLMSDIMENRTFMPRDEAEYNFDYKQVIPYVIIRHRNEFLLLKRTKKQTEKRLHDKYSLGIGGHINPVSSDSRDDIIMNGLYKELNEEISLSDPAELNFIGVINDESNSVSRVHLGLLYVHEVRSPGYRVLETEKMTAQWVTEERLTDFYPHLETWSQIVCDHYIMNKGFKESRIQGIK